MFLKIISEETVLQYIWNLVTLAQKTSLFESWVLSFAKNRSS